MTDAKVAYYRRPQVAGGYRRRRFAGPSGRWIDAGECAVLADLLGPGPGLALDLACGEGRLGRVLAGRGWQTVGLDASPAMMRGAAGSRVAGLAGALPFGAGVFAAVGALRFLFHLADPEPVLAETARVLRPGGLAAFDVAAWTPRSLLPWLPVGGGRIHGLAAGRLREMAARHGLVLRATAVLFALPPSLLQFLPLAVARRLETAARAAAAAGWFPPSRNGMVFGKEGRP